MGASSFSKFILFICLVSAKGITHQDLGFTVVLALFLHKIPEGMAFGSFLGYKNNSKVSLILFLSVGNMKLII